jgi:exodeoxyribonuclease V beta subunit
LAEQKHRRGVMGFNDLLLELAHALAGEHGAALALALAQRYRAALIDEFQDTDPLQFDIFARVFIEQRAPTFLVGDPKQAIYSFRGADLFAYLAAREQTDQRHTLTVNRRSTPSLVQAVGRLFGLAPQPFLLDQLEFPPVQALESRPPLMLDGQPQAGLAWQWLGDEPMNKDEARRQAALATAADIAGLLARGACQAATLDGRAIGPADIAVLGASHQQLTTMQAALTQFGVASVRIGQDSVFASEEAQSLLPLLLALHEPNDAHVRAVLISHLGGRDAATLHALGQDDTAWEQELAHYRGWAQLWQRRGVLAALEAWLLDSGAALRIADWQDGERRLANLLHLFELAEQESRRRKGAPALISWFRQALAGSSDEGGTRLLRLESDAARVRLVTIHASKGLQYPIVFCPFLWDGKADDALQDAAALAEDSRLASAHDQDGQAVLDFGSPRQALRHAQARRERLSERLRLLYVALTRAEAQLVIGWGEVSQAEFSSLGWLLAGGQQATRTAEQWRQALAELIETGEGMAWLAPADGRATLPAQPAPAIAVATLPRKLHWQWQMSSFSSLTAGLHDEKPDHDAAPIVPLEAPPIERYDAIASFPAGPRAGVMLHSLFEEWAFDRVDAAALREHAHAKLVAHGFDPVWTDCVAQLVDTTLDSPVTPYGDRLRGVPPHKMLVELEFTFVLRPFGWAQLIALLSDPAHGLPAAFATAARHLRSDIASGFLKGFIDLACELDGRYWVLDYKSNKLGRQPEDYNAAAVETAMADEHYYLQALIYCVAVHRYLKWRRPGYDYAAHFGGASYLFLRGLDPATPMRGVWAFTPPLPLVEALERLLCGDAA